MREKVSWGTDLPLEDQSMFRGGRRQCSSLVMTDQSDFYSRLSAIQFAFNVDELRATIITLKQ